MSEERPTVLFLDDDPDILAAAELVLGRGGFTFEGVETPAAARVRLDQGGVDLMLLDLNFRRGDTSGEAGLAFLEAALGANPYLPVVVVTGHSGMAIAIQAMRLGARDFVVKPWNNERFVGSIKAALQSPPRAPISLASADLNLERSERALVQAALTRRAFNVSQAAKDLGITRAALYRRMEKHGL
jgi:DNA-binding NtrC family response regulator